MKKLLFVALSVAVTLTSCDGLGGKSKEALQAQNDSLMSELNARNSELDDMMGTFNEISEGFRQINEAENRVDLQRGSVAEGTSGREQMVSDVEFIKKQMQENREQIAKLQSQLSRSRTQSSQLKKALESLQEQLNEKEARLVSLQEELAARNVRIQELDDAVASLSADKQQLTAENEAKAQTVAQQDADLHKAWFVFGTLKELKEQNIVTNSGLFRRGDVMKSGDANKDYFTECDIRTTREIKLYSKSAKLLTTHPDGTYSLDQDSNGEYIMHISNPEKFWSTSKYLVIQVR